MNQSRAFHLPKNTVEGDISPLTRLHKGIRHSSGLWVFAKSYVGEEEYPRGGDTSPDLDVCFGNVSIGTEREIHGPYLLQLRRNGKLINLVMPDATPIFHPSLPKEEAMGTLLLLECGNILDV